MKCQCSIYIALPKDIFVEKDFFKKTIALKTLESFSEWLDERACHSM